MKKIGLALSGGAVLGAFHIGVLKALTEKNITISYISGTSIGAFVAALYAFTGSREKIYNLAKNLSWFDIGSLSLSQYGLLSNKKIGELISQEIGDKDFSQSHIPLAMIATDIVTGEKIVLDSGNVSTSVMASTCIPGIFIPIEIENKILVDGGIVENIPISPLKKMGADFIISVDLFSTHTQKRPENILEIIINAFDFMIMNNGKLQENTADLCIKPDLSSYNKTDTSQFDSLFTKGYEETKKMIQDAKL